MPKSKEDQKHLQIASAAVIEAIDNCEFFISEFVYIEDRDVGAIKFELWDAQREALRDFLREKFIAALKARQLGFTWLAIVYGLWICLHPGKSVLALSKTEEDAKELIRRVEFVLRHLPLWFIVQSNVPLQNQLSYDFKATEIVIYHPGNEQSTFKSFPAGANSGRSFTGNLLILDEWAFQAYAKDIYMAAMPTINRPTGGQMIGLSTILLGTWFETIVRGAMEGTNKFKLIFWPWYTDPRRDRAWYDNTLKSFNNEIDAMRQEYPATIEEALATAGGKFFPMMRADVHLQKPRQIIDSWVRYRFLDYGTDMLACYWCYIDSQGYARIYRELYKSGLNASQAAQMVNEQSEGETISSTFAPDDLWANENTSSKSVADIFAENSLYLTKTSRKREPGWVNVKEWLAPHSLLLPDGTTIQIAKITIDNEVGRCAAPNLWRCMVNILASKNNPKDAAKTPHELTHAPDALRAFCTYWQQPSGDEQPSQEPSVFGFMHRYDDEEEYVSW